MLMMIMMMVILMAMMMMMIIIMQVLQVKTKPPIVFPLLMTVMLMTIMIIMQFFSVISLFFFYGQKGLMLMKIKGWPTQWKVNLWGLPWGGEWTAIAPAHLCILLISFFHHHFDHHSKKLNYHNTRPGYLEIRNATATKIKDERLVIQSFWTDRISKHLKFKTKRISHGDNKQGFCSSYCSSTVTFWCSTSHAHFLTFWQWTENKSQT